MTAPSSRYAFVPGGPTYPTIVGGEGCFLHTTDGRRILDGAGGAIVGNVGWGRDDVGDAIARAARGGAYSIPLWPTEHRLELRDRLVERWLPDGFGHVFFTSGGSESTDTSIRLARAYQLAKGRADRWKVIGRHPSYHGMTIGTIAVASHNTRQRGFEPLLLPFPKVPWDDPEEMLRIIEQEDPNTIAGFLAEPITGAAGACLTASDDYWRAVTDVCKRHDILLMVDEVMTGYGRTGLTFGHQHFPIEPDVLIGGKGLGGGYVPIGAVTARDEVAEALRNSGFMYFTFSGNDIACAGAVAVLDILERESLVDRVAKIGPVLEQRLRSELGDHPVVSDIRGRGLFYGVELRCDRDAVVGAALARDLWVYPAGSGPVPNAIMIAPPFVIETDEIDQLVSTLKATLDTFAPA